MSKRWIKILLPLLLALLIFGKPLFEKGCGWAIRAFLAHHHWHVSFDDIRWNGEGFLFLGVAVEAPDAFVLKAEKIDLSLRKKMIEIERPHLTMIDWKFEDDWPDWKISMQNGTLQDEKIGEVQFFMERIHPDQIVRVLFERNGSSLALEALREGEDVRLFGKWKSFDLKELNRWIEVGRFSDGKSEGGGQILFTEGKKEVKAHLDLDHASYAFGPWKGEDISLKLDWEGPLSFSPECRIRAELSHALCSVGTTGFEINKGSLSSFPSIGAKIELESHFPWAFQFKTGFEKAPWMQAEMRFAHSSVYVDDSSWSLSEIGPVEMDFLQALLKPFFSEIESVSMDRGKISARGDWDSDSKYLKEIVATEVLFHHEKGSIGIEKLQGNQESFSFQGASFSTPFLSGTDWKGKSSWQRGSFGGKVNGSDLKIDLLDTGVANLSLGGEIEGAAKIRFGWEQNQLTAQIEEGSLGAEFSNLKFKHLGMKFTIDPEEIHCYDFKGEWAGIPFFVPHFILRDALWGFDFRLEGPTWDLLRLWGTAVKGEISFDSQKSHLLGSPLEISSCLIDSEGIKRLHLETALPLRLLETSLSMLREKEIFPQSWDLSSLEGSAKVSFHIERGGHSHIAIFGEQVVCNGLPFPLELSLESHVDGLWELSRCSVGDWTAGGKFRWQGTQLKILEGFCKSRDLEANIRGIFSFELSGSAHMLFSRLSLFLPEKKIGGDFKGEGRFEKGRLDLDLIANDLKLKDESFENRGSLQVCYSRDGGLLVRGIDLSSPLWNCKIGLLQYDAPGNRWISNHSQFSFPSEFLSSFNIPIPLTLQQNIELMADIEWTPHLSLLQCRVSEGFFSIGGSMRHLRDLKFTLREKGAEADFQWFYDGRPLSVGLNVQFGTEMKGVLRLYDEEKGDPLIVDWGLTKEKKLNLYRIEGRFGGLDASFYRELEGGLIGSLRIDFSSLESFLPPQLRDLQLGSGYELKGRFLWEKETPSFEGILTGKEIEVLGYRFRTLLAQVDLSLDRFKVTNFKLSDSAGILQIQEILGRLNEEKWKIEIPQLLIQELRPSLLQKIGEAASPMSPLIIRELKMIDFQATLGDKDSYLATGNLFFINSYRRARTMYDLPADVLGLLVGLDQELLIPACGTIQFDMKEGRVHLAALDDVFSQGKRSQFFLVNNEDSPYIDLDGNLNVLIKMKQFVLFKFTEFFLISIEGKVTEPQVRLQKKKGIFGL